MRKNTDVPGQEGVVKRPDATTPLTANAHVQGKSATRRLELLRTRNSPGGGPNSLAQLVARYAILENAVELFAFYDTEMHIVWSNRTAATAVGMDNSELVGRYCHSVWHHTDRPCDDCPVLQAMRTGQTCDGERTWNDGRIWQMRATPVKDGQGAIAGVAVFGYEITSQRNAMKALEVSEAHCRQVTEAMPLFVFATNAEGEIQTYNKAAKGYLGLPASDSRECFLLNLPHPSERESAVAAWHESLSTGKHLFLELRLRRASDGQFRWHEVRAVPVNGADGRITGWFGTAVDIHDRREAEEALLKTNRLLSEEKQLLEDKNIALREVMDHVREQDKRIKEHLQANIDRWLLPLLHRAEPHCDSTGRTYLNLLQDNLSEIVSPFHSRLASLQASLTPREMEICHLIRSGMDSKEMAATFHVSVNTIFNQRRSIRRKLGINGADANLATFLAALND